MRRLVKGWSPRLVNAALADVLRRRAVAREIEFAKGGGYADLLDPEVMKNAWR